MTLRLEDELEERLVKLAEADRRSLHGEIVYFLWEVVCRRDPSDEKGQPASARTDVPRREPPTAAGMAAKVPAKELLLRRGEAVCTCAPGEKVKGHLGRCPAK
jgi:hypothetical protein